MPMWSIDIDSSLDSVHSYRINVQRSVHMYRIKDSSNTHMYFELHKVRNWFVWLLTLWTLPEINSGSLLEGINLSSLILYFVDSTCSESQSEQCRYVILCHFNMLVYTINLNRTSGSLYDTVIFFWRILSTKRVLINILLVNCTSISVSHRIETNIVNKDDTTTNWLTQQQPMR